MLRRLMVAGIVAGLLVLQVPAPSTAVPEGLRVRLYKGDLDFPVDMTWVPATKKLFFTEKNTGRVRVMINGRLLARPCIDLDVQSDGERGALGIVVHPGYSDNHWLYVYYTKREPLENRVTRFTVRENRCKSARHVVSGIPSSSGYHNGGQLEFVAGKLFVSTGEVHDPALAQDTDNRLGKVLRYNADGSVPAGNPFGAGNPVWSYGHRNPFGLTHEPRTQTLFSTENGPSCDDEFNRIRKGNNYGWGSGYQCGTAGVGDDPKAPLKRWSSIIVPTDPWWYEGKLRKLNNSLYVGDHTNGGQLHRIVLNAKRTRVNRDTVIHTAPSGINDVSKGPGGYLYFLTTGAIYRIERG